MMSSFMIDLMPSAIHTRKPCGPARFGPMRDCMRAETRRSTQVMIPATGAMKSRMIAAATERMSPAPSRSAGALGVKPSIEIWLRLFGGRACRRRNVDDGEARRAARG